jgi:PAS domain S-box-containing protein
VLMDIMIDGVADGIEAATQIGTRLGIPVVYLTGLTDARTLERARDSDAFGDVPKPFAPSELGAAIEVALHTHEMSKKLKVSEALYRAVVEDQTEFICRFQSDGTLTFVNQAYCHYFGRTPEELIGRSFLPLIPEDDQRRVMQSIASLSAENPVVTHEHRVLGPDGEIRWQRWTDRAIFDELGGLVEFQAVGRDITDRVRAEETLRESEETARALLNAPADLAMLMDTQGIIIDANEPMAVRFNKRVDEMIGMSAWDHLPPEVADHRRKWTDEVVQSAKPVRFVDENRGTWFDNVFYPILDANGNVAKLAVWARDITDYRRAEESLKQRNRELELLNRSARVFTSSLDLSQVLAGVLEEVRSALEVATCSVWLIDRETNEARCRQAVGPGATITRSWRLPPGVGLVGHVALSGESLIVPDAEIDERCFKEIGQLTGVRLRSILSVPIRAKGEVIGVIQVVDTEPDRFNSTHLWLVEALASSAAIAIENACLHAQVRQLAAERERHRLARELHDTVTQSLYGIGMVAQTSLKLLDQEGSGSPVRGLVEQIRTASRIALAEMREQLYDLHPSALAEKGLVEALLQHCDVLSSRYSLSIEITGDSELSLSMSQRETLYYIAREALWNVVKHAGATRADVLVTREDDRVVLSVVDDGNGFDPACLELEETIGLRNMEERAGLIGGTFQLQSDPKRGTRVTVRIPVGSAHAEETTRVAL